MTREHLSLVGLSEDRTVLILLDAAGSEFTLPVNAALRAALRGDQSRIGQLEIRMDSALRPRDIQARIRSGESPETVAVAAKTTVDKIMVYALPVLAERAHVAERAQRSSVRRSGGEGPTRMLGVAVAERLEARNVDPASVEWDAWRREDGRWTLVADYHSGESHRHAEFVYDAPGRYVIAEDDEAMWLIGEHSSRKGPQPRPAGGPRRLSAVPLEDQGALPLGEDAIEMVTGSGQSARPVAPSLAAGTGTSDVADATGSSTDAGRPPTGESQRHTGATDDDDERTVDMTQAAAEVRADDSSEAATEDPSQGGFTAGSGTEEEAEEEAEEEVVEAPERAPRKARGRASVPSWDEIMFGGAKEK